MADISGLPGGGQGTSPPDKHDSDDLFSAAPSLTMTGPDGAPLPAGIHLMLSPPDQMKIDAAKERVFAFASRDEEAVGERVFQMISGMIKEVRSADTDEWVRRLRSLTDLVSRTSEWVYTHSRFNRRYSSQGIYTAGRMLKERYIITVAVDVSASVLSRPGALEKAFGGIESLLKKYTIELVCLDEQLFVPKKENGFLSRDLSLSSRFRYSRGDWKLIKTGSGGATFFAPLFNTYMTGHKEALLVITDGQIYDLPQLKKYTPTLWVITTDEGGSFEPPFGRAIKMD
jgi:predicted metal-dependent peptidase